MQAGCWIYIHSLKPPVTDQVQVSSELVALSVLNRDPLGAEDSSDSSPLVPLMVRGSLGEAEGGTIVSQLEEGGIMRHGVHPGGEDPITHHRSFSNHCVPCLLQTTNGSCLQKSRVILYIPVSKVTTGASNISSTLFLTAQQARSALSVCKAHSDHQQIEAYP